MSEEQNENIYITPSDATSFFNKHMTAMSACSECPANKSFALNKEGLHLNVLQQIAESFSVGKKCFVVFEHDSAFEVHRAADGTPRNLLMRYAGNQTAAQADMSAPVQAIVNVLRQYSDLALADVVKYDNSITELQKQQDTISQMYLQRRLLSTAPFKRGGKANEVFKEAISSLVDAGFLLIQEGEQGSKVLFTINKEKLNAD